MPNSNVFTVSMLVGTFNEIDVICDQVSYDHPKHIKFYNVYGSGDKRLVGSFPYSCVAVTGIREYVEGEEAEAAVEAREGVIVNHGIQDI